SRRSVRARIALLALIPVVGSAATGAVYQTGAREVNQAFDSVRQAAELADASRELKNAVGSMGAIAQEFAAGQRAPEPNAFFDAHASALVQAQTIGRLGG